MTNRDMCDRPLAIAPLISYRCKSTYGWIMIGAADNIDAMREASRSSSYPVRHEDLQIWNGTEYVPAFS